LENRARPALAKEIEEADAFVLLVGEKGLGPWQELEYYAAHDKHVKSPGFPVVFMLLDGHSPRPVGWSERRRRTNPHPCARSRP
jgi:hypothetical protein